MAATARLQGNAIPSSSPAFGTPVHPFNPPNRPIAQPIFKPAIPTILPILLSPASLRPLAFRTFTKKHSLTLGSSALQSLATFVGRHCGSGWREDGTAEKVLDEIARQWKLSSGPVIVEDIQLLKDLLKLLEGCMSSGHIDPQKSTLSRQSSLSTSHLSSGNKPSLLHQTSFGLSGLEVSSNDDDESSSENLLSWLSLVPSSSHPRFTFSAAKSHFLPVTTRPSLLPSPLARTTAFRDRYAVIHSLILRNPAFQAPTLGTAARSLTRSDSGLTTTQQTFRLTPIANLLGRSGSAHLLLGMLALGPAGGVVIQDLSGSISLDLAHAKSLASNPDLAPWLFPGAIVLVEGVYREDFSGAGSGGLGGGSGVGGLIGGRFITFSVGAPPIEKRTAALGVTSATDVKSENKDGQLNGGFGWTAFLPSGSEKAVGSKMRRLENRILLGDKTDPLRRKIVVIAEVNLDLPECLDGLRRILQTYAREKDEAKLPLSFVLIGSFVSTATMAEGKSGGSIEYKELFNALAAVLSEFPALLRSSKWTFVPGDNDGWASSFAAGSSVALPCAPVPDIFTSRIKRTFREAKAAETTTTTGGPALTRKDGRGGGAAEASTEDEGPRWTSNPTRMTLFGTAHEIAILRDDISGRIRRTAIKHGHETSAVGGGEERDIDVPARTSEDVIMLDVAAADGDTPTTATVTTTTTIPSETGAETGLDMATTFARRLVLSVLPQASLAPFPPATRPVHAAYATAAGPLALYPLPHTLVLADAEAPAFAVTYEGCHVVNPGRMLRGEATVGGGGGGGAAGGRSNGGVGRRGRVGWAEYDAGTRRAEIKELWS